MKDQKGNFLPITPEEEAVGKAVVNAAYVVHKETNGSLILSVS